MMLEAGTRLGAYEIVGLLGKGGMGEVYRATDTRLEREVALKTLPAEFARDPERAARFEREAKVLASLNHPHIAALYGLEEVEGLRFLVMEMVEGETLLERLQAGALPVSEALDICRQIAEALEAAHEHEVIHRDLKPANVKITPEGIVKVLDFGLAKGLAGDTPHAEAPDAPTITARHTRVGTVLGTPAYMSPEQARAQPLDKRTDIWSFGCVLFQCLTRRPPFDGDTVSDTIARILERELDFSHLPDHTPPGVRHLLARCLEKEHRRRLRDIGDAVLELEEAVATRAWSTTALMAAAPARNPRWRLWVAVVVLGVLTSAMLLDAVLRRRRPVAEVVDPARNVTRLAVAIPADMEWITFDQSPDGRAIVYAAVPRAGKEGAAEPARLYLRRLDRFEAEPVPGTEGGRGPLFSPSGHWVVYRAYGSADLEGFTLQRVGLDGTPPVTIADPSPGWPCAWVSEDTLLLKTERNRRLATLSVDGGQPVPVPSFELASERCWIEAVTVLAGGEEALLALAEPAEAGLTYPVELVELETGARTRLLDDGGPAVYTPTGHLVFTRDDALMAVPFDLAGRKSTGRVNALASDVGQFAISRDGQLAYRPYTGTSRNRRVAIVNAQGEVTPASTARRSFEGMITVSPDGKRAAVQTTERGDLSRIWLLDLAGGVLQPLTKQGADCMWPAWSPDGTRLAYAQWWASEGEAAVNVLDLEAGEASTELLHYETEGSIVWPSSWVPHGRAVLVNNYRTTRDDGDVVLLPTDGSEAKALIPAEASAWGARFSPSGALLAYGSVEGGQRQLWVAQFDAPTASLGERKLVTTDQYWGHHLWAREGHRLLFLDRNQRLMAAEVALKPELSLGAPQVVADLSTVRMVSGGLSLDAVGDGTSFIFIQRGPEEQTSRHLRIVLNWFEELRARAPEAAR